MLGYVKHQRTLVSKGGKSKSSSSSSTPPVVTATTTPPPTASTSDTDERLKSLMHSFLSDFFAQSSQLGTNPFISAPPPVPNSSSQLQEAAGGVGAVTPFEAPLTETPGEVLPMTQVDHPPPIISVHNVSLVRGVVSSGGGGSPYPGQGHSVGRDVTDQLRITGISCEPSLTPLSALFPSSFLYPSSDSGFVSLYSSAASISSRTSVAFVSSASSSLYTSSFTPLSSSASSSSFSLPPLFLSSSAFCAFSCCGGFDPSSSSPWFSSSSSWLSSSFLFLFSSSFSSSLPLSASSGPSPSLLSVVSSVSSAPVSSLSSSAPFGSSYSPSSSFLDYASFKAYLSGVSDEYLSLACLYNSVDGSDFFSFLSSHCPHLSADVAKDFSSGSSVLLSTLRSSASLPSDRPASSLASLSSSSLSSSAAPALLPSSLLPKGFAAALDAPVSSSPPLSSLPSGSASLVAPPPLLAQSLSSSSLLPPSLSGAGIPVGFGTVAVPGPSALPQFAPPVSSSSLFCPFDASAGPSSVFSSSPTSAPPSGVLQPPVAPLGSSFSSSAPGPSFAPPQPGPEVPEDASFDPVFADPSALGLEPPLAPFVLDSVRVEVRHMYAYIVDLFPHPAGSPAAPPPPRALFEDFFVASPASTPLPVFLDWFARVRTSLSEVDARLASLLASGRPDSSLLLQCLSHYVVHWDLSFAAAVPVNPSLLSMFECTLRPSLQLGISLREACLMESSSCFHSEALSHSMWLLSAILAFVRLQGFSFQYSRHFSL